MEPWLEKVRLVSSYLIVLYVRYPKVLLSGQFRLVQISKWAGLSHNEDIIRRALAKSSFKSMRRKEEASGLRIFDEIYPNRDYRWRMTRKGISGGWEDCFTSHISKDIFNEIAYDVMHELGYVENERW